MRRTDIVLHEQNPRHIDKHARAKLKKAIQKGYVGGIVWNRQTSRLVAGHQRISILDELHGGEDYALEIDVIDVDEKREKELLISLNNPAFAGEYDLDKLGDLLEEGLDASAVGFDRLDLEDLFPDRDFSSLFADSSEPQSVLDDAEEIARIKAEKKRFKEQGGKQDDANFVVHLVFPSSDEAARFLAAANLPTDAEYIDGRRLAAHLGVEIEAGEEQPPAE